jgi:archaellum component FlaC
MGSDLMLRQQVEDLTRKVEELGRAPPRAPPLQFEDLLGRIEELEQAQPTPQAQGEPAALAQLQQRMGGLEKEVHGLQKTVRGVSQEVGSHGSQTSAVTSATQVLPLLQKKLTAVENKCKEMGRGVHQAFGAVGRRLDELAHR